MPPTVPASGARAALTLTLTLTLPLLSGCHGRAPAPVVRVVRDAGLPVVRAVPASDAAGISPVVRTPSAPQAPVDSPALAALREGLAGRSQELDAWLRGVRLVEVTAGGFAAQPFPRVVIDRDAIGAEDVAMLNGWRRRELAEVFAARPRGITPVFDRALVQIRRGVAQGTHGDSPLAPIPALADALRSIQAVEAFRARGRRAEPERGINVVAVPDAPSGLVLQVVRTAESSGFPQYNLVERRDGRYVVLAFNIPGASPDDGAGALPVTVGLRPGGYTVTVDGAPVAAGCHDRGPAGVGVLLPGAHGVPDTAGLSACMAALRTTSRWHDRLATQQRVRIEVDPAVPYRNLLATVSAVEDSAPGARDLFTDPVIGLLR